MELQPHIKLKQKYSAGKPDVIVASDVLAPFLIQYGKDIMVWTGQNNYPANLPAEYVVLPAVADFDNTIRLIIEIRSGVKRIYSKSVILKMKR